MGNLYEPELVQIAELREETDDTKTLKLIFKDEKREVLFKAGQFCELSVFGEGEATFCIASSPTKKGYFECTVKRVGKVTRAMHEMDVNSLLGFRGPYGNWFPIEGMKKKNLLFVGGGIGLAPLRSLIWNCLDLREDFADISILYGARSPKDLVYKYELNEWEKRKDVGLVLTVDAAEEEDEWKGKVGLVPSVLKGMNPSPDNGVVVTCGPPIMIKFTIMALEELGFRPEQIITTLEMRMKCGVGKCGRCNIGRYYVCKDGPVFSLDMLEKLPGEY